MKTKLLILFLSNIFLCSTIWASPPSGAKMDEYMKKRFITISTASNAWFIDFSNVSSMSYKTSTSVYTVYFTNGHSEDIPFSAGGSSPLDSSYTLSTVWAGWIEYAKFLKSNPQFHSIP